MTKQPRKSTITMHDVARQAGVSQSTVSRVLSGAKADIAITDETRQRVMAAVQELGYQPNLNARSLRGQKSHMIAVMIADIANPFYHPIVRAIQDVANQYLYDVTVSNTDYTAEGERRFLEAVMRRPVDGIIMVVSHLTDAEVEDLMERTGAAIGIIGQRIAHPTVDIAYSDDGQAMQEATTWLIEEKGHRRVGFIGIRESLSAPRRLNAYRSGLKQCGIAPRPEYEVAGDWTPEGGHAAMHQLLALDEPPTAVLACNDMMAIGAMGAAREQGVCIPRDVALVGFDDVPAASWLSPALTTIAQYPYEMGERLAEALFERIAGGVKGPGRRFKVPCRLIEREST